MACTMSLWGGQMALAADMPTTYTQDGATYTLYPEYSTGSTGLYYYEGKNNYGLAYVTYTDNTYKNIASTYVINSADNQKTVESMENDGLENDDGGLGNRVSGRWSYYTSGLLNTVSGGFSAIDGGSGNIASEDFSVISGGTHNIANGLYTSVFGGKNSVVQGQYSTSVAGGSTGSDATNSLAAGNQSVVTVANGTAIGYQATTNQDGTIAFGHDAGDVSGYTVTWQQRTDKDDNGDIAKNGDGTTNDYTKAPTITETTYDSAYYNRLVKVADGQDAHDVATVEQTATVGSSDGSVTVTKSTNTNGSTHYDLSVGNISVTADGKVEVGNTGIVNGGTVYTALNAEQTAREAADTAINNKIGTLTDNGNYIQKDASVSSNLSTLDSQVKTNADAIVQETSDREAADTAINNKIGTLTDNGNYIQKDASVSSNLSTLDSQVKTNADAIAQETSDRETADTAINNKIGTLTDNGNYIQKDASVSGNLSTLDSQVKTNADAIAKETSDREAAITNITNNIGALSDSAVKYDADLDKTKVTLAGNGGTTITNVKDGSLSDSSTDAVNGSQLYTEQTAREAADTAINTKIGTLTDNGHYIQKDDSISGNLSTLDTQVKANADSLLQKADTDASNIDASAYAQKLGTGTNTQGDTNLVNGDTLYNAVKDKADISYVDNGLAAKAGTDLQNITDAGKSVITDLAKGSVKVIAGTNTTVTEGTAKDGAKTYAVNVEDSAIQDAVQPQLDQKANVDASNLTKDNVASWQKALGTGAIDKDSTGLVTGQVVYQAIKDMPTGEGLVKYDSDTKTITVAADKDATKVDFSGKDSNGNTINRTLTGIVTDATDATSAANVGYVQDVAGSLANGVQRVANQLSHDINKVGAGAAALAGLHPGEFDPDNKLDFAAGYGHYKGANAGALGAYYHPNEDTIISLAGTMGNGDPMLSAGVTFKLGPSGPNTLSRTALTKQVASVQKQNQILTAQNQAIAQKMAAVDQKNQQLEKDVADLKAKLAALLAAKA